MNKNPPGYKHVPYFTTESAIQECQNNLGYSREEALVKLRNDYYRSDEYKERKLMGKTPRPNNNPHFKEEKADEPAPTPLKNYELWMRKTINSKWERIK